ncbi:MAG: MFS transporter [Chloroflexi bacterium]|nr:MFS transporter [Chloroflexota bacterium]
MDTRPAEEPAADLGATARLNPIPEGPLQRAYRGFHDNFLKILLDYPFLFWVCLVALLAELGAAMLNVATIPLHLDVDLNAAWATGWVIASFLLVEALFKPPFGALSDRIGRKLLMIVGPIFSGLCCYVMYHATQPWQFIVMQGFNGLGYAAFWPSCYATIADRVRRKDMNTAMSVFNLAYLVGVAFAPLTKSLVGNQDVRVRLAERITHRAMREMHAQTLHPGRHPIRMAFQSARIHARVWKQVLGMNEYEMMLRARDYHIVNQHLFPFLLVAVLFLLTAILAVFVIPSGHAERPDEPESEKPGTNGVNPHDTGGLGLMQQMVVGARTIPWMMVIAFFTFLGIGFLTPCLLPYVLKVYNVTERQFGTLLLPVAGLIGIAAVPLGRMNDRWGSTRAVRFGMSLCALSLWFVAAQPFASRLPGVLSILGSVWVMIPMMTVVGLGFVIASPAWMARVTEMSPENLTGAVLGAAAMAQGGGALVGGVAGGYLWDHFQHSRFPEAPAFACAAMLSVGTLITLWHVRPEAARPAKQ